MLNKSSIQAAFPVALNLAGRGIVLDAVQDSPLAQLTSTVFSLATDTTGDGQYSDALREASMTAIAGGEIPHDVVHAQIVGNAVKGVRAALQLAQGVVAPLIKQCVLDIENAVDAAQSKAGAPLSVVPFYYKDIWDHAVLLDACERYEGRQSTLQLRPIGLPVPANWTAALSTGVPSLDEVVVKFINDSNPEFLAGIWNSLFGANVGELSAVVNTDNFASADAAIVAYLAARNMMNNIPAGLNIELGAWRDYMVDVMASAGGQVMVQRKRRGQIISTGRLILSGPAGKFGSVTVFGDNYDQFLSNGGSPEAILGAHISNRPMELRAGTDSATVADFANLWKAEHSVIQQRCVYEKQDLILRTTAIVISKAIAALEGDRVVPAEVMQDRLREMIARTEIVETKSLWTLVRKLVCGSMFAHTDAERILQGVDDVAAEGMNVREAAFLATADYVVEWLLEQVIVTRVKGA